MPHTLKNRPKVYALTNLAVGMQWRKSWINKIISARGKEEEDLI